MRSCLTPPQVRTLHWLPFQARIEHFVCFLFFHDGSCMCTPLFFFFFFNMNCCETQYLTAVYICAAWSTQDFKVVFFFFFFSFFSLYFHNLRPRKPYSGYKQGQSPCHTQQKQFLTSSSLVLILSSQPLHPESSTANDQIHLTWHQLMHFTLCIN